MTRRRDLPQPAEGTTVTRCSRILHNAAHQLTISRSLEMVTWARLYEVVHIAAQRHGDLDTHEAAAEALTHLRVYVGALFGQDDDTPRTGTVREDLTAWVHRQMPGEVATAMRTASNAAIFGPATLK